MSFFSFDLDPITSIVKFGLDIIKMYLYSENEVPSRSSSKDRQTRLKLLPIRTYGW